MKNKKGFTLIELLAVIAILGIVITIGTYSVSKIMNKSKTDSAKIDDGMVKKAAELYANENYSTLKSELESSSGMTIGVDMLINSGYLSNSNYNGSVNVKIDPNTGKTTITSSLYDRYVIQTDNSGANAPVLATGLIPVIYDEKSEKWEVADTNESWYNYENHQWANAVTVSDASLRNAKAGTELDMSKINSMWVWIPRYKYRIPSNIGSTSNVTNPPEIDVVFESGTNTTGSSLSSCSIEATNCYYTHPAFRNGSKVYKTTAYDQGGWDKELSGIWVGKFSTSESNGMPKIIPNVSSKRKQNISTQFVKSLLFSGGTLSNGSVSFSGNSTYGLTSSTDTHMMKNTEWGAVAYLSQSKYGKKGNPNYNGINKEIYVNNGFAQYYTGRSGGGPSGSTPINETYPEQTSTNLYTSYGFYTYDDYLLKYNSSNTKLNKFQGKGTGASTTGTIYGIYDMVGSRIYVMGNNSGYSGYSLSTDSQGEGPANSGFNGPLLDGTTKTDGLDFPPLKYYEKYTPNSNGTNSIIKGDAGYETMRWYNDLFSYMASNSTWFMRGSNPYDTTSGGIFMQHITIRGNEEIYNGYKVVLIP